MHGAAGFLPSLCPPNCRLNPGLRPSPVFPSPLIAPPSAKLDNSTTSQPDRVCAWASTGHARGTICCAPVTPCTTGAPSSPVSSANSTPLVATLAPADPPTSSTRSPPEGPSDQSGILAPPITTRCARPQAVTKSPAGLGISAPNQGRPVIKLHGSNLPKCLCSVAVTSRRISTGRPLRQSVSLIPAPHRLTKLHGNRESHRAPPGGLRSG